MIDLRSSVPKVNQLLPNKSQWFSLVFEGTEKEKLGNFSSEFFLPTQPSISIFQKSQEQVVLA